MPGLLGNEAINEGKVSDVKPLRNGIDAMTVTGQGSLKKIQVRVEEVGPDFHITFETFLLEQAENSPAKISGAAVAVSMKMFVMSVNGKEYGLAGSNLIKVPRQELPLQAEVSFVYSWVGKDYKFVGHQMPLTLGLNPAAEGGCCVIS